MATKDRLGAIKARIAQERDELDAEILRTEERLSALKSLKAGRDEDKTAIDAVIGSLG